MSGDQTGEARGMLGAFAKRVFDVVVGGVLLLLVLPVIAVCAVGTAIALHSWPFFTQYRVGRDGREFRFLKLRTLPPHAPKYASKYEIAEISIPRFTLAMRRLHVDELPQLFLVVIGKMSLVGPRPEMHYLASKYGDEFIDARTRVRPGCTGLWQVSENSTQMIFEHPEFDLYYVQNRSLRFDLWIIARTIRMHLPGGTQHVISMSSMPAWSYRAPQPVAVEERSAQVIQFESTVDLTNESAMQAAEA